MKYKCQIYVRMKILGKIYVTKLTFMGKNVSDIYYNEDGIVKFRKLINVKKVTFMENKCRYMS